MNKKLLAVVITATMMLTACCSCGNHEETSVTGPDDVITEETEETTADEQDVPVQDEDYVIFGHYEQDGDDSNGPEPIEWKVLSEEDGRMLLISRYILDYQPYNTEMTDVTWETCSLRTWLNDEFINAAFDTSEQEQILTMIISTPDYVSPYGVSDGGNDTEDKVFLLSCEEADTLFANDDERAVGDCDWWWLRSPGHIHNRASVVLTGGEIYPHGHIVSFNNFDHGVRPALWLEVDH